MGTIESTEKAMQGKSRQKFRYGAVAWSLTLATVLTLGGADAAFTPKAIGETRFAVALNAADMSAWQPWRFSGETRYTLVEIDGRRAVKAVSDASASGYYRRITVDLNQAPVLRWSWRVENTYGQVDETLKAGDDSPARVFVLSSHPLFFWRTRALAYVWSNAQPAGSDWPSAYTSSERVIAVRSGQEGLGEWHQERRNVRDDFKRYFGKEVRYVDAVAFMTDSDNTGRRAVAYYGDIFFAER